MTEERTEPGGNGKAAAGKTAPATPRARIDKGSAILRRSGSEITLSDLDTAGYVYLKMVPYVRGIQVGPAEYEIVFYDPEQKVEQLIVEFTNAECSRYADAIRRLKKVIIKPPRSERGYRF